DREQAIERLCRAIDEYYIKGIHTTLQFGKWAVRTEAFRSGNFDTKFIEKYFKPEYLSQHDTEAEVVAALLSSIIWEEERQRHKGERLTAATQNSGWKLRRR